MADNKSNVGTYFMIILVILIVDIIGGFVLGKFLIKFAYNVEDPTSTAQSGETLKPETIPASDLYMEESEENVEKEIEEKLELNNEEPGEIIQLDDIILNPAQSQGEFFTCKVYVEFAPKAGKAMEEFEKRLPRIQWAIFSYLSEKTVEELSNEENWDAFRTDMLKFVHRALPSEMEDKVTNLYVTQRLIQY
jgi:flagellar basal body-associated protein FliL